MRVSKVCFWMCLVATTASLVVVVPASELSPVPILRHDASGLEARMLPGGASLRGDAGWTSEIALQRWGRGASLGRFERGAPAVTGDRVQYADGLITEWWKSPAEGLEQGWTLARRPVGPETSPLVLEVGVSGDLTPIVGQRGTSVDLTGAAAVSYGGLVAFDASGRSLPTVMTTSAGAIIIEVDDSDAFYPVIVDPFVQTKKLIATSADPNAQPGDNDRFGLSAAIDGDTVIIGAPFADTPEANAGFVYVFGRDQGGSDNWGLVKDKSGNFGAGDNQAGDSLGWRTAIDGDIAAISHTGDDEGATDVGAVSVLSRDQGGTDNWGRIRKLFPASSQTSSSFGSGLALEGDTLVVGGEGWDESGLGTNSGGLWIFLKDLGGSDNWGQVTGGRIPTPGLTAGDSLGAAVDVNGDIAVAGMPTEDSGGEVRIHARNQGGANNWGHVKTLVGSDTVAGDRFGDPVRMTGDTIVVGAPDTANGVVYVFERNEGGTDNWGQTQRLVASDGANGHQFGAKLDVEGSNLVIGATQAFGTGTAYHFTKSGGVWTQQQRFDSSDGASADAFGSAVSISGSTVVVGAPQDDSFRGSAYIFDLNNSPVANNDAYNGVVSGGTLTVATAQGTLDNDTDTENNALTAAKVTDPANGTLTAFNTDGSFTYVANAAFVGTDTFTYKANDGTSDSGNATVSITVATANVAPVANNDAHPTNEDTPLNVAAAGVLGNDTDGNGDALSVASNTNPSSGTLAINANGSFIYTPNANFNGTDSFTYTASDSALASGSATVTITVNAVNDAPVANDDAHSTGEDTVLNVAAPGLVSNDTDVDGDVLTPVKLTDPANGSVTFNKDTSFSYTPNANFNGADSFTYKANDGTADSNTATVTITVNAANDAPVAVADSHSTDEDTVLNVAAPGVLSNDTDGEGDALSAVKVTDPSNGTVSLSGDGSFSYTPNADFNGTDSFTYKANDGTADSNTATVTITVNGANDAPVAVADSHSTDEDTVLNVAAPGVLSNDTDGEGDALSAVKVTDPSNGTVSLSADGSFSYTPNANFNGTDSFTYKANDGTADSNTATVTITVNGANDAPVAVADSHSTDEDTVLNVAAPGVLSNDTDGESDALSAVKVSDPSNGTVSLSADGSFSFTPNANFNGTDSFTYKANDGTADSNTVAVTITVSAIVDLAALVDDSYDTQQNQTLNVPVASGVMANDTGEIDSESRARADSKTANGTLSFNADGSFEYAPDTGFNGTDTFTYSVDQDNDGTFDVSGGEVTITVAACSYALSSSGASFDADGGTSTVEVTTGASCEWESTSDSSWITIDSSSANARGNATKASGSGSASYTVAKNPSLQSRSGKLTLGAQTFSVTQDAAICEFSINPNSATVPGSGGQGTVGVTAVAQTGGKDSACTWTAQSNASWLTLSTGVNEVTYTVARNVGAERTGTATIGGQTFTAHQSAGVCNYSFDNSEVRLGSGREEFSLGVQTENGCEWSAAGLSQWILRSPEGAGSGVASFRSDFNGSSVARVSTVVLRDAKGVSRANATVMQASACTATMSLATVDVAPAGGTTTVRIEAPAGCSWRLVPSANWLRSDSSQGTGSGEVTIKSKRNSDSTRRRARFNLLVEPGPRRAADLQVSQGPAGCRWTFPVIEVPPDGLSQLESGAGGVAADVQEVHSQCVGGMIVNSPAWLNAKVRVVRDGRVFAFAWSTANPTNQARQVELQDQSGNTIRFRQAGSSGCGLRVLPEQREYVVDSLARMLPLSIETGPGCKWEVFDFSQSRRIAGLAGSRTDPNGGGTFFVGVNSNQTRNERVGTFEVAGEQFTIRQLGAAGNNTNRFTGVGVERTRMSARAATVKATWDLVAGSPDLIGLVVRQTARVASGGRTQSTLTEHSLLPNATDLKLRIQRDPRGRGHHCFDIRGVSAESDTRRFHLGCVSVPDR